MAKDLAAWFKYSSSDDCSLYLCLVKLLPDSSIKGCLACILRPVKGKKFDCQTVESIYAANTTKSAIVFNQLSW